MAVFVSCPSCGVKLDIPESFLGKKVRCATCSSVFEAKPDPSTSTPLTDASPPPGDKKDSRSPSRRGPELDDYDSDDEPRGPADDDRDEERRYMRRDLAPHHGGLILGLGIGSVVTGFLSFCCCALPVVSIPMGAVSWIMGQTDMKRMDKGDMDPDGRGITQGGYICGIIGCALGCLGLVCIAAQWVLQLGIMMNKNGKGF